MIKTTWYDHILTEYRKETVSSVTVFLIFVTTVTLWGLFSGKTFEWQSIEPISKPSIFNWRVYGAIVFISLGAFMYYTKFYKFLYSFFRGTKNGWREYNKTKKQIWGLLILFMFFVVIPFVVWVLNGILSILFNLYILFLYIIPSLAITFTVVIIAYFLKKKMNVL